MDGWMDFFSLKKKNSFVKHKRLLFTPLYFNAARWPSAAARSGSGAKHCSSGCVGNARRQGWWFKNFYLENITSVLNI